MRSVLLVVVAVVTFSRIQWTTSMTAQKHREEKSSHQQEERSSGLGTQGSASGDNPNAIMESLRSNSDDNPHAIMEDAPSEPQKPTLPPYVRPRNLWQNYRNRQIKKQMKHKELPKPTVPMRSQIRHSLRQEIEMYRNRAGTSDPSKYCLMYAADKKKQSRRLKTKGSSQSLCQHFEKCCMAGCRIDAPILTKALEATAADPFCKLTWTKRKIHKKSSCNCTWQMPQSSDQHQPMPPPSGQRRPMPPSSGQHRQIPSSSGQHRQIPSSSGQHRQMSGKHRKPGRRRGGSRRRG